MLYGIHVFGLGFFNYYKCWFRLIGLLLWDQPFPVGFGIVAKKLSFAEKLSCNLEKLESLLVWIVDSYANFADHVGKSADWFSSNASCAEAI